MFVNNPQNLGIIPNTFSEHYGLYLTDIKLRIQVDRDRYLAVSNYTPFVAGLCV